jgi:hypothetical protein
MRGPVYRDYVIIFNPADAPGGRFRDAFSVHKCINGSPDWRVSVYQRSISDATEFLTEQEAVDSAFKMAEEWIDAQYS